MNAYKIRSIVMADGTIILKGIPFSVGKSVEIIVLEDVSSQEVDSRSVNLPLYERWKSLQGSVPVMTVPLNQPYHRSNDCSNFNNSGDSVVNSRWENYCLS